MCVFLRGDGLQCKYCLAEEARYFYKGRCRRCMSLPYNKEADTGDIKTTGKLVLAYPLTKYQQEVSQRLCVSKKDVFVEAVCGAGKTEVCLELVQRSFAGGMQVGWTIPRRQVVLELAERLQDYFPDNTVTPVCEGFTETVTGDLIVFTTHQLFRYYRYFDLLIVDEPDAFPFSGDMLLMNLLETAVRGRRVYLSATKDKFMADKIEHEAVDHLTLPLRPSLQLLPVPQIVHKLFYWRILLCDLWKHRDELCLVFVPTRKLAALLSVVLNCAYITSQTQEKDRVITGFRNKGSGYLVCTTVLERGVTFVDCMVFIVAADHRVFTASSLIQIAGRVGRGLSPKKGACYAYCNVLTASICQCLKEINAMNACAQSVLNR